ncbi:MAG TPA: matrixin family metalloprotease [Bryobacteraceae bacterium]|nr:matrixin family metalloprotease [Bryobacteraceae bacterium]
MKALRSLAPAVVCFAGAISCSSTCSGYVRLTTSNASPLIRTDNTAIQFQLNTSVIAGVQSSASGKTVTVISPNSDPQAAVRGALATWNGVTTANIKFLPLKATDAAIDVNDKQMTIAIGSTASDLSIVGGALAVTVNFFVAGGPTEGDILDSDIIINPAYAFSTDGSTANDLQSVMTHELGHSLSANHTGLLGASMFQFNSGQRFLTTDDLAFVNAAYPLASGGGAFGTISGSITASGAGVPFALITATDTTAGVTVGGVSDHAGNYSMKVPPGSYQMYCEPLNGVVAINIYLDTLTAAGVAAVKFQTTTFGPPVSVAANATTSASLSVTPGAATIPTPVVTAGPVNVFISNGVIGGPVTIPSGGSYDLVFAGQGFDATLNDSNFTILGQGVTLHAGSVRVDKTQSFGPYNLLRLTLDVAARSTPELASVIVTSGSNSVSFSGALVVVPPTPTFVSKGVISAASSLGSPNGDGAVSPGGIYTIYDLPNVPNLGPAGFVINGPYDAYGNLATILGGVSVTFDGVPAPMFFSYGGQLNLQVPFEVAGKASTKVVINYLGSPSASVSVPVLAVQPAFFTSCIDGKTLCAINLKDHTFNSASNPAGKGEYVEVYGTGVGNTTVYTVLTGQGAPAPPWGYTGNYTYSIGGSASAAALYGGWTPTAAGLAQWDLQIPATSASGAVPISVTDASGATSQPGAIIFVK